MNRDKMLEAMMKAVTDAVVDVNVDEILSKVYPQIDEKIHETYGFLPEIHEVRTPTATHKICGTTHEKFDEVLNIVNLDIPVYLTGKAGPARMSFVSRLQKLWVWIFTSLTPSHRSIS